MKTVLLMALIASAQEPLKYSDPAQLGLDQAHLDSAVAYLAQEAHSGAFPGAVLAVGRHGAIALIAGVGVYGVEDSTPVSDSTIYDLASLTKVVALTSAAAILVSEHRLSLDARVQDWVPGFVGAGKENVLVRHLLTHTSGLPPFRLLYEETDNADSAWALALRTPLEAVPGERYVYSDLGAMALQKVIESVADTSLDVFVQHNVFDPLGMAETRYLPDPSLIPRIAPTENDPWRGHVLRGEVHDENASRLGGVSGHAGLFSTAADLSRLAFWLLDLYQGRIQDPRLDSETLRNFVTRQDLPEGSTRALGWDTPSPTHSSAGTILSRRSFGHTGYTGTSIWIDPTRDMFIILLTNRVHPTRDNIRIRQVRPRVADIVAGGVAR